MYTVISACYYLIPYLTLLSTAVYFVVLFIYNDNDNPSDIKSFFFNSACIQLRQFLRIETQNLFSSYFPPLFDVSPTYSQICDFIFVKRTCVRSKRTSVIDYNNLQKSYTQWKNSIDDAMGELIAEECQI